MVATMPPIRSDLDARSRIAPATWPDESRTDRIASLADWAASTPCCASSCACSATWLVCVALSADSVTAAETCSAASRADSTTRTWRSVATR